jgi:5-methyltetrahydropteroyltriglutamate--homocysteine methyltransferase
MVATLRGEVVVLIPAILPATVVGSYPQPEWLIDRDRLRDRLPPRVRAGELWRIDAPFLEQAQDDATILAIRDMERAGIDIVTDGEIRRESYSNRLANALSGIDLNNPGSALDRTGHPNPVPRISGAIRRTHPVEVRDLEFLRANTDRAIKITLPGPFTMAQQAQNDFYADDREAALAYAAAVNDEVRDLFAAGADIVQLDEPYLAARPENARAYGVEAIDRALAGIDGVTAIHLCFGYAAIVHNRGNVYPFLEELAASAVQQVSIEAAQPNLDLSVLERFSEKTVILGVLNLGDERVETPDIVAGRIRAGLAYVGPDRLVVSPDCGMKYLPREIAFAKLVAMVEGARLVRRELGVD